MEPYEFDRHLDVLRKIILDGLSYFLAFQSLNTEYEESLAHFKDHGDFWYRYRGFFAPARNALMWSTLLQFAKVYDGNRRALSLMKLVAAAREVQGSLTPFAGEGELEAIQASIARNLKLVQKLKRYRNARLAHYDTTEPEDIGLPVSDVSMLVDQTKTLFNSLKHAHEGTYDDFAEIMKNVVLHSTEVIGEMKKSRL